MLTRICAGLSQSSPLYCPVAPLSYFYSILSVSLRSSATHRSGSFFLTLIQGGPHLLLCNRNHKSSADRPLLCSGLMCRFALRPLSPLSSPGLRYSVSSASVSFSSPMVLSAACHNKLSLFVGLPLASRSLLHSFHLCHSSPRSLFVRGSSSSAFALDLPPHLGVSPKSTPRSRSALRSVFFALRLNVLRSHSLSHT